MPRETSDLYQLLGVGRLASAADLRRAYEWCLSTRPAPQRRAAVQEAYAVLGDPRLRAEYDRGRVVGVGAGTYYRADGGARRPASSMEQRWERRTTGACPPTTRTQQVVTVVLVVLGLAAAGAGLVDVLDTADVATAAPPPATAPQDPPPHPAAPYAPTGACFAADGRPELRPTEPVSCDGPHLFEVVKNVDLTQLLRRAVRAAELDRAARDVCTQEFSAFTGLAGSTQDLWPTWVNVTGGGPAQATCLAQSRHVRTGSAAGIAD